MIDNSLLWTCHFYNFTLWQKNWQMQVLKRKRYSFFHLYFVRFHIFLTFFFHLRSHILKWRNNVWTYQEKCLSGLNVSSVMILHRGSAQNVPKYPFAVTSIWGFTCHRHLLKKIVNESVTHLSSRNRMLLEGKIKSFRKKHLRKSVPSLQTFLWRLPL